MTSEEPGNDYAPDSRNEAGESPKKGPSKLVSVAEILGELLITLAVFCALYVVWQLWWTGVQSEHRQLEAREASSWSKLASGDTERVARPQHGNPPVEPESAADGELMAQLYIPRFGEHWERNVVQGTSPSQLAYAGIGHYPTSQMPGELGNVALAGHRAGYGEPLAHVDEFKSGDAIVLRTKNYWYVYHYTSYKIVLPDQVDVIAPNPEQPDDPATKRMITLTTCEPKYSTATHRWVSWGEFDYWAKVSDGVPRELMGDQGTDVLFADKASTPLVRVGSLQTTILVLIAAYLVIYLAALLAWRYPLLREIKNGTRPRPVASIYGWILRHQSGTAPIRWILMILLILVIACALLEWGFPWLATNVPYLRQMSNYSAF